MRLFQIPYSIGLGLSPIRYHEIWCTSELQALIKFRQWVPYKRYTIYPTGIIS